LSSEAYHYFAGAVARYCLEQLTRGASVLDTWSWWVQALYPLKERQEHFKAQYLSRFSGGQRAVIAELLRMYAQKHFEEAEMSDEDAEWAARHVWCDEAA
jgi:hypothetical protein